ncbi:MAG: NAD(P)/FAD-dependent oxidoreductase [Acidimicrobiales bacterium]|jgi:NADH dehydrogenase|nr:NAD(P)/FAD-dependent oxidoreductase [Acidimicrobiales bacterium]
MDDTSQRHRVVVVGSGFGGLFAVKALRRAPVDVTLISSTTYHLFQPLLYQVATGILSSGEVAPATRDILSSQRNLTVLAGTVKNIDLDRQVVRAHALGRTWFEQPYDSLIVAAGAGQSYFGNDHFAEFAPGMKSIDDALELRGRIFGAFEMAEVETDPEQLDEWLSFVVVGAGPTGVEMAGQIAELAHRALRGEFRRIDPHQAKVILLDAAPQVLPPFGEKLGVKAKQKLERLGVEVQLGAMVVGVDADGLDVRDADGSTRRIPSRTKVWAAGVSASPLGRQLAEQSGAEIDRAGRVHVDPDLTLPGHPEVFVVGDMMALDDLPGVAQVAMQGGKYAAKQIKARLKGKPSGEPFHYFDKGSMAVIARNQAVAKIGSVELWGIPAWLAWLFIHLIYLVGFKNRFTTLVSWFVTFVGRGRPQRAVTVQQVVGRQAIERVAQTDPAAVGKSGAPPSRSVA